jgi:hypothetical protein
MLWMLPAMISWGEHSADMSRPGAARRGISASARFSSSGLRDAEAARRRRSKVGGQAGDHPLRADADERSPSAQPAH